VEPAHRIDDAETRTDSPLGIVLMCPRVAEISEDPVAHIFRDKTVELADDVSDGVVIGSDDLAQVLRVEACGEPSRAHQVAEHDGELTAFGAIGASGRFSIIRRVTPKSLPQKSPSVANGRFRIRQPPFNPRTGDDPICPLPVIQAAG
jgi:hypothetical protein